MAYKLTYQVQVAWVGPGAGPMQANTAPQLPNQTGTGQVKEFSANNAVLPFSNTFTSGDITTLTNAMAADMVTQMNASITAIQAWASGNP